MTTIADNTQCRISAQNTGIVVEFKTGKHAGESAKIKFGSLLAGGSSNTKMDKNEVPTLGLSMTPHKELGMELGNVCPWATTCIDSCLGPHSGRGFDKAVQRARLARRCLWLFGRKVFLSMLEGELETHNRTAQVLGQTWLCRLNVYSDILWERFVDLAKFDSIAFYDYTKAPIEARPNLPSNYWVTYSFDGTDRGRSRAVEYLQAGRNVAVVFFEVGAFCGKGALNQNIPHQWEGFPVVNGDKTDDRNTDPKGVVVGLRLKGRTKASRQSAIDNGFAVPSFGGCAV